MRKNILTVGSAALAIAAALTLSGCGGDGGSRSGGLNDLVGGGSSNSGSDSSNNSNNSNNSGGGDSGSSGGSTGTPDVNVKMNGTLPDGWPSGVVVPEGDITFSGTVDDGFSVIMTAERGAVEDAIEQLKRNGFSETTNFMGDSGGVVALENSEWTVGMLVGSEGGSGSKWSVIYTVTPR